MKKIVTILTISVLSVTLSKFTLELASYFENFESQEEIVEISFDSYKEVLDFFEKIGYDLSKKEVPAVILKRLPRDMDRIKDVQLKKDLFVRIILPIILKVNEEIKQEREEIMELGNEDHELTHYLTKYKAKTKQELLEKVDVIPVEIALAQAAIESAWGTSRFALEANNIFGEWTFSPGNGIVPRERPDDEIYEVRRFKDLLSSVRSYAYNLNVSPFYREFRAIRLVRSKSLSRKVYYITRKDARSIFKKSKLLWLIINL